MPRVLTETVNAAQIYSIVAKDALVNGQLVLTSSYVVGNLSGGIFTKILGAGNFNTAVLNLALSTTFSSYITQVKALVVSQEGLDTGQGDKVMFAL